jgi:hypothetical protein
MLFVARANAKGARSVPASFLPTTLLALLALVPSLGARPAAVSAGADLELVAAARGARLDLSLDRLAALPQVTVVTANGFVDGTVAYRGPLARDVLAVLALDHADRVRLTAANDYFVDVPTGDFRRYDVILAMEANGRRLSLRDKGPLWLMYPISDHPELADRTHLRRLIWQVVRIEAL